MPTLTLSNFKQDTLVQQAIIDLSTGMCVVGDQHIEAKQLNTAVDFVHPLLTQPTLFSCDGLYVYEYDDFDGLLDAAKFVYATLIQEDNARDAQFNIRPSSRFVRLKKPYQIPFSTHHQKPAKEYLSTERFNAIISQFNGVRFHYQDTLVLEQVITLNQLPTSVNGDGLYQRHQDIIQFCKQADDFSKYEIRYINQLIGFGVFARQDIANDELITHYCGLKNTNYDEGAAYAFGYEDDVFNLRIEAMSHGNLSRFINHAPKKNRGTQEHVPLLALTSNVVAQLHAANGNDVIVYRAIRAISKGEQLFLDYGDNYFPPDVEQLYLRQDGTMIHADNKTIKEPPLQRHLSLQWMSEQGVKEAQWLLVRKPLIILGAVLLIAWFVNQL